MALSLASRVKDRRYTLAMKTWSGTPSPQSEHNIQDVHLQLTRHRSPTTLRSKDQSDKSHARNGLKKHHPIKRNKVNATQALDTQRTLTSNKSELKQYTVAANSQRTGKGLKRHHNSRQSNWHWRP